MLNLGNAKCCICWQEGPASQFLILAHCICQRGMGGVMALVHEFSHYGDSSSVQLWAKTWLSHLWHSRLSHQACWAMWTVVFSVRNNAYIMCVLRGWGWGVVHLCLCHLFSCLYRGMTLFHCTTGKSIIIASIAASCSCTFMLSIKRELGMGGGGTTCRAS